MTGDIQLTSENLKYLPKGADVVAGCISHRYQERGKDGFAYFLRGERGDFMERVPIEEFGDNGARLPSGSPDIVERNYQILASRMAASAKGEVIMHLGDDGSISEDGPGIPIAFREHVSLKGSAVKGIYVDANNDVIRDWVTMQEAGVPFEARKNVNSAVYRLNQELEKNNAQDVERIRKGLERKKCLEKGGVFSILWPGNWF